MESSYHLSQRLLTRLASNPRRRPQSGATFDNNGLDALALDVYSYAFGYLIEGVQRTIMSYVSETLR